MSAVFARTKIQPPRQRAGLLERQRIAQPLAEALIRQRLVLVCAPAGFGKTVALTQQIATLPVGTALAWVSADDADDLGRFASCLVAALDPYDLPWRISPEALVASIDDAPSAAVALAAELLNALAATEVARGLIVVDDLHRLHEGTIFVLLERLIERLPEQWGVVLVSRLDPPLPLARWRARGELAEWRQHDLCFTPAEGEALAAGRADAAALHGRTGGWAAGLGLLLGGAASGSLAPGTSPLRDRHMFDYLASEVLDDMAGELRDFLLRCSVLPELSARRCAAVSGDGRAAEWLETIERRGLFVSVLDEREPTLRLHDLFRDCLGDRLRREHPEELPTLLRRAAADESDPLRRIGYLARAGAWDEAETVLSAMGPELLAAGAVPQVLRLIEQFPAALREASPALQHLRGLCAWAHWDWLAMGRAMTQAAAGWHARGDRRMVLHAEAIATIQGIAVADDTGRARLQALADAAAGQPLAADTGALFALARSWQALDDSALADVAAPLTEVVTLLEQGAPLALWFHCLPLTAFLGLPGARAPLQRYATGVLRLTPQEPPSGLRVLALALQAGLVLFAGDADAAWQLLQQAEADCRWLNRPPMQTTYLNTIGAYTHALRGERDAALAATQALLDGLDDERSSGRRTTWLRHFLYQRLRIAAALDDAGEQREMAARLGRVAEPPDRPVFVRQRGSLAARLAALDGRWREAAAAYAAALADETALDHYGQAPERRARWAQALLHDRRPAEAAAALAPALARLAASGEVAGLRMAGPRALAQLAGTDWGRHLDAAQSALLLAAAAPANTSLPAGGAAAAATAGPLTARETDVLARLAGGDSNKLIARALDLSPHTVKRHVANILDKLGVNSRGQAAAWYRSH